jgi:hypothetical protein
MAALFYLQRYHVKTEAAFTAPDPWNQNRPAPFTVEDYTVAISGSTIRPDYKPRVDYVRGIRSNLDGVERLLPESLSALWRDKRVPSEALPRLLHEMEPTLENGDHLVLNEIKEDAVMRVVAWIGFGFVSVVPVAAYLYSPDGFPLSLAAPVALGLAGFGWLTLYRKFYRKKWRRARQTKWILARI